MECYTSQDSSSQEELRRPLASYHPNLWDDHSFNCTPSEVIYAWHQEASILKESLKKMLRNVFAAKGIAERLKLIDTIQRLGIAYHFEQEIHQALKQIFNDHTDNVHEDDEILLFTYPLKFRLLRQHGYNVSCDVFNRFKFNKKIFKNAIIEGDAESLLSLYEATFLGVHGEETLDEIREFTRIKLEEMVPHLKPSLARHVRQALSWPIRRTFPRLLAKEFITFYQDVESHSKILLKFAKLDFNILQKQHQEELNIITKWWKSLDVEVHFPYARHRIAECYFWTLGTYYEPEYTLGRKFFAKIIAIATIIDDTFDAYGTQPELELFTKAIQSIGSGSNESDIKAIDELPQYMKMCHKALVEVYKETEDELSKMGRSFVMYYAKDAMIDAVKAQHEESKWRLQKNIIPTMEDYINVSLDSSFYQMLAVVSFIGMGEIANKESFEWLMGKPQMVRAQTLICRLMDDIVSHEYEQQRVHPPSAVECYMNQHGVAEKEACEELNKQVENAWKDINQGFFDLQSPSMPLLTCILNLARVIDLMYTDYDCYTNSTRAKQYLASLLVDPLEV